MTQASWWEPGPAWLWQRQPDPDFAKFHGAHLPVCSSFLNSTQDGGGRQIKEQNLRHLKQPLPMALSSRKTPNWKDGARASLESPCWAIDLKVQPGDAKAGARAEGRPNQCDPGRHTRTRRESGIGVEMRARPGGTSLSSQIPRNWGRRTKGSRSAWATQQNPIAIGKVKRAGIVAQR